MASSESFRELWTSWQNRQNYAEVYERVLVQFASQQTDEMRAAKSCVGFGPGAGDYEIDFIRRFLPSVQTVIAVEQDEQSVVEFQRNLTRILPHVQGTVHQTSLENWAGVDGQVDVVLAMRIFYQVREPQRRALFQRMFEKWLSPGGYVVLISHTRLENPNHAAHLYSRLNPDYYIEAYDDIKRDMIAAGFQLEQDIEFQYERDYSNPDDRLLRLHQHIVGNSVSLQKVRETVEEMFPEGKTDQNIHVFAVFQKPVAK